MMISDGPKTKFLHLLLQSTSLVGFAGGNLCGTNSPCVSHAVSEVFTITAGTLIQLSHVTLQ